jgi:5-methylcytosine-specific restriction endonuclease McrA
VPDRLPHGCATPGCPELVRGAARCPEHERALRAEFDSTRPSGSRRYPPSWRVIRLAHLRREPLCRFCAERGVVTGATEVDHVDGDRTNHAPPNLRSACKPCHSRRTARDQAFVRRHSARTPR